MTSAAELMAGLRSDSPTDELFRQLRLREVRLVKWCGEILSEDLIEEVTLQPASAGYLIEDARVACRFDQTVELAGQSGEKIASISVAIVVDFYFEDDLVPHSDVEALISTNLIPGAWNVAYPYVREAVHTMSTRLGLDAVALGILDPTELQPQEVNIRGVAEFRGPL